MKKTLLYTSILFLFGMFLCGFSLYAGGNHEFRIEEETGTSFDLSLADSPDTPSYYQSNLTTGIWYHPGYLGRIKYIGEATVLTFNQTPSNNTPMLYFTHTSKPGVWSEYFLVGNVRGQKKSPNESVYIGTGNFIITGDGGTITIPVNSGKSGDSYSSTWVDLILIRKNQAHQDIIPNGNYKSNFTVSSNKVSQVLSITLYGNRNAPVSVAAWLSLTPENMTINLSDALGTNKVEVAEAKMNLIGDDYQKNYGVIITFRDYFDLESSQFKFKYTLPAINTTIPFTLLRGTNPSQTQVITPKTPITWDYLSFVNPNIWKLYITNVQSDDFQKSLSGTYKTTIRVEITPMDSNTYMQ